MNGFFSDFKTALGRLCRAIEFRVLLALLFVVINTYPFVAYRNLEKPWFLYLFIYGSWAFLIFILFLLSFSEDSEGED